MFLVQLNEAGPQGRTLYVQMVSDADGVSPAEGLSLTVEIVKAGQAAYAPIAGAAAEIGQGTYAVMLAAGDVDCAGPAMLRITATGALPQYVPMQVVRFPGEVHLAKAALANSRTHAIDTGIDQIHDDDGVTVLRTLTPDESDGIITVSAS